MDKIKEFRDSMLIWARQNLVGKIVKNKNFTKEIEFTSRGLKHTLKGKNLRNSHFYQQNFVVIESIKQIEELLTNATYIKFEPDNKNRENVKGIHLFEIEYISNNTKYQIRIIVKETRDKTFFYDHSIK